MSKAEWQHRSKSCSLLANNYVIGFGDVGRFWKRGHDMDMTHRWDCEERTDESSDDGARPSGDVEVKFALN